MGSLVLVHPGPGSPDGTATAKRMLHAAPHRGGSWETSTVSGVTLGICWDPEWRRAWLARHDDRLVAFAGVLDNERELRTAIRRTGRDVLGDDPADTLLSAIECWGSGAVRRLRGVFTGAVVEPHRTWVFRDHFGLRPLFVRSEGRTTLAATEVKQVVAGSDALPRADLDHLEAVLYGGIGTSTAFAGVERVPGRTILELHPDGGRRLERYWDPDRFVETLRIGVDEAVEGVAYLLERATHRMRSGRDVIMVSGGLDSPSLAALACSPNGAAMPAPTLATGIYPEHPSMDERSYTRALGAHLGLPVHEFRMQAGALDDVHRWVALADGPVSTLSLPECAQSYEVARHLGGRTMVTGELAENVFMGRSFLLDHLVAHGRLVAAARQAGTFRRRGKPWERIVRECLRGLVPGPVTNRYVHAHSPRVRHLPPWIDPDVVRAHDADRRVPGPRHRWRAHQTSSFTGSGAGFEADETCAASIGVEVRRPFADIDLWQFVLGLPAATKVPPDAREKVLLRDGMRGRVPDVILDRTDKTYFDAYQLARADYPVLRGLLQQPQHRIRGVDYGALASRLDAEDMGTVELHWSRDLARIHAFLDHEGRA